MSADQAVNRIAENPNQSGTLRDASVIVAQAQAAISPTSIEGDAPLAFVVPERASIVVVDPDQYAATPRRAKGAYVMHTLEAFTKFVERHEDLSFTTVWVDVNAHRITAIIDDHGAGSEGAWRDFRVRYELTPTDEWKHWSDASNRMMDQTAFAEHIEEGLDEIVTPPAAVMLELAQTFQAQRSAEFRSGTRLSDGNVQLLYNEQTTAAAGASGDILIPETFQLGISPFVGQQRWKVIARLRWRVREGKLTIGYKLQRPEDVIRACIDGMADELAQSFGERVFFGAPGS